MPSRRDLEFRYPSGMFQGVAKLIAVSGPIGTVGTGLHDPNPLFDDGRPNQLTVEFHNSNQDRPISVSLNCNALDFVVANIIASAIVVTIPPGGTVIPLERHPVRKVIAAGGGGGVFAHVLDAADVNMVSAVASYTIVDQEGGGLATPEDIEYRYHSESANGEPVVVAASGAIGATGATLIHAPILTSMDTQDHVTVELWNVDLNNPVEVAIQVNPSSTVSGTRASSTVVKTVPPGSNIVVLDRHIIGGNNGYGIFAHVLDAGDVDKIKALGDVVRLNAQG